MKKFFNKIKELSRNNKFWYVVIAILSLILIYFLFFRKKSANDTYEEQYDIMSPVTGYSPTYTTDTGSSGLSSSDIQNMIDESAKNTQDLFSETLKSSYDMTLDSIRSLTESFSDSYKDLYSQISKMQEVQQSSTDDIVQRITDYDKQKEENKKSRLSTVEKLIDKIQQNSLSWHTANDNKRKQLESQTRLLRQQLAQEARNQGLSYSFVDDTGSASGDTYQQIRVEGYGTY